MTDKPISRRLLSLFMATLGMVVLIVSLAYFVRPWLERKSLEIKRIRLSAYVHGDTLALTQSPIRHPTASTTIEDAATLSQVRRFFPDMHLTTSSNRFGGWIPCCFLTFELSDGRTIRAMTNYQSWSTGEGDYSCPAQLQPFLQQLINDRRSEVTLHPWKQPL
jgi:hypothetical protein